MPRSQHLTSNASPRIYAIAGVGASGGLLGSHPDRPVIVSPPRETNTVTDAAGPGR